MVDCIFWFYILKWKFFQTNIMLTDRLTLAMDTVCAGRGGRGGEDFTHKPSWNMLSKLFEQSLKLCSDQLSRIIKPMRTLKNMKKKQELFFLCSSSLLVYLRYVLEWPSHAILRKQSLCANFLKVIPVYFNKNMNVQNAANYLVKIFCLPIIDICQVRN